MQKLRRTWKKLRKSTSKDRGRRHCTNPSTLNPRLVPIERDLVSFAGAYRPADVFNAKQDMLRRTVRAQRGPVARQLDGGCRWKIVRKIRGSYRDLKERRGASPKALWRGEGRGQGTVPSTGAELLPCDVNDTTSAKTPPSTPEAKLNAMRVIWNTPVPKRTNPHTFRKLSRSSSRTLTYMIRLLTIFLLVYLWI
ncbi:hypothetical protein C8F04DRAFT_1356116 [Mycena alexandri]|uniref:Uncharacterized protein n=1 Tax=Mycena alexandri TaxID=1745969 RepID=A0AAD6X5I2_9AGAR|nr:hypothetical protein C8F04DRAFT_1356116 [Mycena alexandri]